MIVRTISGSIYEIDEDAQTVVRSNEDAGMRGDEEVCKLHQFWLPKVGERMKLWITLPGKDFSTVRDTTPVKEIEP